MPAPTAPPTGTVTFLFTDIEGSTRLWEAHPVAMKPALARHDALLRQSIEDSGGYVFKTVGDAFCAAFPTANQALEAALAAQLALNAEPWELSTPLLVRMALHTGAAEERGSDYFGQPLNRVARLMAAGYGGQTLLSDVTQGLVRDALPPSASLLDLGERRLKDLERPEQVFQLQFPALPAEFPPLRSLDNPALPNNLPQQMTSFIGREKQIDDVKALLGRTRLLTLTGAGGSGKTRLSLQVAADLLDRYFDGVWLVELAALTDPSLVPQAIANVLGIKEEAGKSIQTTLVDWLSDKRILLVLDNCEHLVTACASLAADLLRSCPNVHLLASSRETLNVSGEQAYRVPSLSVPDPKQTQTVESLSQFEAVRLFIERAQAVQASFTVTNANAPAVAQVCFRLDGIPLAIELAAARVRSLSVDEISARLDNRFRLLTGGARNTLPRQQTLRALIDWSYDLLTEQEKTLLGCLSVFAGGWTLDAVEAVGSNDTVEKWEVLDLLTALVDKSLVVYEEKTEEAQGKSGRERYHLLESVRQYAGDRLAESGKAETVLKRAASWFLSWVEEVESQLIGPEQAFWLERLESEHDNLRASLTWYEPQPEGAEAGLRLAGALWRFWAMRGYYSEGRRWLGKALEGAKAERSTVLAARGKALTGAGVLASVQGDYGAARALHEMGLILFRQLGDQGGIAYLLNSLGGMALDESDYVTARDLLEESLLIKRRLEDPQGVALSLNNLGILALEQNDYAAAWNLLEESLTISRKLRNQQGISNALNNLGNVALARGDYGAARDLLEESLTIMRQLGDQGGIASSLNNLAGVASCQGDFAGARALYAESLTIKRWLGNQQGIAISLEGMAEVAQGQNQLVQAAQLWGAALSLRDSIRCPSPPLEQEKIAMPIALVHQALGEEAFAAAWDEGRAMTMEQAIEYALAEHNA